MRSHNEYHWVGQQTRHSLVLTAGLYLLRYCSFPRRKRKAARLIRVEESPATLVTQETRWRAYSGNGWSSLIHDDPAMSGQGKTWSESVAVRVILKHTLKHTEAMSGVLSPIKVPSGVSWEKEDGVSLSFQPRASYESCFFFFLSCISSGDMDREKSYRSYLSL